jgi:pimeloyl-ACP methyl ester carboxylesterase
VVKFLLALMAIAAIAWLQYPSIGSAGEIKLTERETKSADGVRITYTTGGKDGPAVLFIHGGLADRGFWSNQLEEFARKHQVIALDLAGHGTSGKNRNHWTLENFGKDVVAVVQSERLEKLILVGNSLGGAVALEAARLLPGRVIGVVAVDTCHDFSAAMDPDALRKRAAMFRKDFGEACDAMASQLFHADADPELVKDVKSRLRKNSGEVIAAALEDFAGYDGSKAAKAANVPIRCLNGDLYPTRVEANRKVVTDFKAVIMRHAGHFPMLERPKEFNEKLESLITELHDQDARKRPP